MLRLSRDGGARLITHESLSESLAVMQHQEAQPKPCVRPPAIERNDWNHLLEAWTQIGPNARLVLLDLADRLVMGNKQYGDFTDDRDWPRELQAELLDGLVYLAIENRKRIK
jgi:hypothetical protein